MTMGLPRFNLPLWGAVVAMVLLIVSIACGGAAVGIVDAESEAPGEPASFFGTAVDDNGDAIPAGTTVVAIVDGEIADRIHVDPGGTYGGDGAFDDKLRVDSEAGDEVTFRFADANGPKAKSVGLEAGVFERDLTFPPDTVAYIHPVANISTDQTTAAPGTNVTLSGSNSTAHGQRKIIDYQWDITHGGEQIATFDEESPSISVTESGTYRLALTVTDSDGLTSATQSTFEVESDSKADIDSKPTAGSSGSPTGSEGGTSGPTGGQPRRSPDGGDSNGDRRASENTSESPPTNETTDSRGAPIVKETLPIGNASRETPGTAVSFENSTIDGIIFQNESATGNVTIREYGMLAEESPPLPGDLRVISVSMISVPSAQRNTDARVRATVASQKLSAHNVAPDQLAVYHLPHGGDRWEALSTETTDIEEMVRVDAETPGFSQFVLAGPETVESVDSHEPDPTDPSTEARGVSNRAPTPTSAGSASQSSGHKNGGESRMPRLMGALFALLVVVGVVGRILIPRRRRW